VATSPNQWGKLAKIPEEKRKQIHGPKNGYAYDKFHASLNEDVCREVGYIIYNETSSFPSDFDVK